MTKRNDEFPSEDNLPRDRDELYDLLVRAKVAGRSFRYTNVIRHRLMDVVADEINEGRF